MNIITREFEGQAVHTFVWNGKPCWIASEIVSLFGYADPSTTIRQCISVEEFDEGQEYDVLLKNDLRSFKRMVHSLTNLKLVSDKTPNLIIFYEDGLYGFLQYTEKPIGVRFRKWVRRVVMPSLRQNGEYAIPAPDQKQVELPKSSPRKSKTSPLGLSTVNNAARIILKAMEGTTVNPDEKLRLVKELYAKAGVEVPAEKKTALPAPTSKNQAFLLAGFDELKEAYRGVSREEIQNEMLELLDSSNRRLPKYMVVRLLEAIKDGKGISFN